MVEVPTLGALVRTFLSKLDVPQLSRDQERTVRAKTRKLFQVADDLHKTALRERRDNMVEIQDLTEEVNKSYERGRSAMMAEGLSEVRAMYEQQMIANTVLTRAHWTITKKWQDTLADIKKTEEERKAEKQNHREWKKYTLRAARDARDTRRAIRSAVAALVAAVRAAADEQDVGIAVAAADAAAVAAADVEAIDGTEAAGDLAKMAAEARALADAAKAAAEAAAAAAALAAAQAAARPEPGLTPVASVRQRVDSTQPERKTKRKKMRKTIVTKETKMKVLKQFTNKAHKPGIKEAHAKREKIVKLNDGTYYSETKKNPAWR